MALSGKTWWEILPPASDSPSPAQTSQFCSLVLGSIRWSAQELCFANKAGLREISSSIGLGGFLQMMSKTIGIEIFIEYTVCAKLGGSFKIQGSNCTGMYLLSFSKGNLAVRIFSLGTKKKKN